MPSTSGRSSNRSGTRWAPDVPAAPGARDVVWDFVRLYVLLPAALIGPPTFMAGFGFPLLQRAVHTDLAHVGRRVGTLLAANILGSTLGAFVTGWLLLDVLGTSGTLKLVFVLSAGFGALAMRELTTRQRAGVRAGAYAGGALVVAASSSAMPGGQLLWARLHGTTPSSVIVAEDGSGLSVLKAERADFRSRRRVRQRPRPELDSLRQRAHRARGASGVCAPESAQRGGDRPRIGRHVVCHGGTAGAGARHVDRNHRASAHHLAPALADHRVSGRASEFSTTRASSTSSGDGRLYLRRAGRKYDIIEADALRPTSAYSGNLYSDAYFRLLRDHLNPGGLAVTWAPTARVVRTFAHRLSVRLARSGDHDGQRRPDRHERSGDPRASAPAGGCQLLCIVRGGHRDDAGAVPRWSVARGRTIAPSGPTGETSTPTSVPATSSTSRR